MYVPADIKSRVRSLSHINFYYDKDFAITWHAQFYLRTYNSSKVMKINYLCIYVRMYICTYPCTRMITCICISIKFDKHARLLVMTYL